MVRVVATVHQFYQAQADHVAGTQGPTSRLSKMGQTSRCLLTAKMLSGPMRGLLERSGRANYFLKKQHDVSCFDHSGIRMREQRSPQTSSRVCNRTARFIRRERQRFFPKMTNIAQTLHRGRCMMMKIRSRRWTRSPVMRHQETYSKHSVDLGRAFSDIIRCADCDQHRPMRSRSCLRSALPWQRYLFFANVRIAARKKPSLRQARRWN